MASALKDNGSTAKWRKIRARILQRDSYTCQQCGGEGNSVDHIVPRLAGGGDEDWNLQTLCGSCKRLADSLSDFCTSRIHTARKPLLSAALAIIKSANAWDFAEPRPPCAALYRDFFINGRKTGGTPERSIGIFATP